MGGICTRDGGMGGVADEEDPPVAVDPVLDVVARHVFRALDRRHHVEYTTDTKVRPDPILETAAARASLSRTAHRTQTDPPYLEDRRRPSPPARHLQRGHPYQARSPIVSMRFPSTAQGGFNGKKSSIKQKHTGGKPGLEWTVWPIPTERNRLTELSPSPMGH